MRKPKPPSQIAKYNDPNGTYKWRFYYDGSDGKRRDKKCRTKAEATDEYLNKLGDFRDLGSTVAKDLTDGLKREAVEAQKILAGQGVSLLEAARFLAAHREQANRSGKTSELVEEYLAFQTREGAAPTYLTDINGRLRRFCQGFGERIASEITQAEIESWLNGLEVMKRARARADGTRLEKTTGRPISAQSRRNYATVLSGFFGWCRDSGTVDSVPVRKARNGKRKLEDIHIFSPKDLEKVLAAAVAWSPTQTKPKGTKRKGDYVRKVPPKSDIIANLVIGAFAGLRDSEFRALHWEDIKLDRGFIDLRRLITKNTASRRLVEIRPVLVPWLMEYCPKRRGPILLPSFPNRIAAFRRHLKEEHGIDWGEIPNVLRHSFASYLYAETQSADKVAAQMGHEDTAMTFRKYREVVTPDDAKAYWALTPEQVRNGDEAIPFQKEVAK